VVKVRFQERQVRDAATAAQGQDPQTLREKSGGLLQGAKPLMEKPDLPPEAAEMFKSFRGMMQTAPTDRPVN
jgi:hypothetical protein